MSDLTNYPSTSTPSASEPQPPTRAQEAQQVAEALAAGIAKTPVLVEGTSSRSINELMAADPLSLTQTDIEAVVDALRQGRSAWMQEEAAAAAKKRPARAQSPALGGGLLDLASLGLVSPKAGEG